MIAVVVVLSRHRLAAFIVLVLVALGAVALAIQTARSDDGVGAANVPEGGSSFGGGAGKAEGKPLMDALAPLLASGGTARGPGSGPASTPAPVVEASSGRSAKREKVKPPAAQEQQLAQLFLVGFRGGATDDPFFERLSLRRWGAIVVDRSNYVDEAQLIALTGQAGAVMRNAGAPLPLIAMSQGGGDDSTLRALPPAAQRSIRSGTEARKQATRASGKLRRLGIRMTLAPSADLGYSGGAWDGRAFSDDPAVVARRASGAIAGWRTGGVAPAVGHFPGEGAASQDPANGPASVGLGLPELTDADLRAFRGPLRAAPALVLSNALYAAYDGVTPATLLPEIPALARRSGFKGMIVSGNLAATVLASGGTIAEAAVDALKAGCDLLWIPGDAGDQEAAYRAVVRAVQRGDIPQQRVRSALAHVAAVKRKYVDRGVLGRGGTSSG
jgi:beta-N-acetylhexosaminidase